MSIQESPQIPERRRSNPFIEGQPMHDLFEEVLRQDRDIIIIIDDFNARRGTGKTVASLQLANGMDQTEEGLIEDKATLRAEELRNAYWSQPRGSGLVLDEGEMSLSNRKAMSNINQALREIMSAGRVEEKYVVINSPALDFIDKDIRKLADVWISMRRKGEGLVHFLERQPYAGKLLTPKKQIIEFEDIPSGTDLRAIYNSLTREKRKRLRGDEGDGYITRSEHEDQIEKAKKEARKAARDELIRAFYGHEEVREAGVSQRVIGEATGLTQQAVGQIINQKK